MEAPCTPEPSKTQPRIFASFATTSGETSGSGRSLSLAAVAGQFRSALALPLLIGGLTVWALGVRALWRHWDLVDRLAGNRDAYVISDVLAYASREATMDRRRNVAAMIRGTIRQPGLALESRVRAAADELEALASELEDDARPRSSLRSRLLAVAEDSPGSPLLNPALPSSDLRSSVVRIRPASRRAGSCVPTWSPSTRRHERCPHIRHTSKASSRQV